MNLRFEIFDVRAGLTLSMRFVVPGDRLGVVEEFIPGLGTYTEDGIIYSERTGIAQMDVMKKHVSVQPQTKTPLTPINGSIVIGVASSVQERSAIIEIVKVDGEVLQKSFSGVLYISASSVRYERNMMEVCKPNDTIRARVVNINNRIPVLTTADRGLGVVLAYCSNCGYQLHLKDNKLSCGSCRNVEKRKISSDYGNLKI